MKNRNLSNSELADYSGEHLLYELQLFTWSTAELARPENRGVMRSCLIECFVIHLRNLIDFLYTEPGAERDDDVIASDFCPGWKLPVSDNLRKARERANKELSHLTLERKTGLHPDKPWDVAGLYREVCELFTKFTKEASSAKLSQKVSEWLASFSSAVVGRVDSIGAAIDTTNTTATITTTFRVGG